MPISGRKQLVLTDEEKLRIETRKRVGDWIWYGAISALLAIIIVAAISGAAAVSPRFCSTCHPGATRQLAQSAHGSLSCDACHRSAGALGLMENRLWVAGMVIQAPLAVVTPGSSGTARVDTRLCADCHKQQLATTFEGAGVIMNHAAPVRQNWSCQRCHRDVGHPDKKKSIAVYSMSTCLECHKSGESNLNDCKTCHPADADPAANRLTPTPWRVTHGANWQQTHGMGNLDTCRACHGPDYCKGCHTIEIPHPANFMEQHGVIVGELQGTEVCQKCHQLSRCDACHGMEMPHPADFARTHKKLVQKDGKQKCYRCHAESSCKTCHERHVHPGVDPELLKKLRSRPVTR